jgi:CcdB protein
MELLVSRIVTPLRKASSYSDQKLSRIHISIIINNEEIIISISEMAAISSELMSERVSCAAGLRKDFTDAIDLLFTGF